ncbi:hypothetical protein [Lactococcus lactis]|uniref:hypothetical protein n=1 Tax=Lactococcus lactis TaxID=1358 RepID=UPI001911C377|nr:hypothetical protein [Lactococcus lactis]WDA70016.1 hypothetical protein IL310_08215 [Lactococcus lactis]
MMKIMQFRWKMKRLFQPKSNKMLFLVASLAMLLVVTLASVSCFLSGVGQASAPPISNKKTLQVATTTKAKNKPATSSSKVAQSQSTPPSSKASAPASQAVAPVESVKEAPNTTQEQSIPASSEEQTQTQSQADIQAQNEARKAAQEKQEAENQQTAQSLKEEYEAKGYTVDVVHQ